MKRKGTISVKEATLRAWNDSVELCVLNGQKPHIHRNTFRYRVSAYVNGVSDEWTSLRYIPLDDTVGRRLRELRAEGLIDYDYKDEIYIAK